MIAAIDPRSGEVVDAEDALPGVIYYCPSCGGKVQVRRPWGRADHFAHRMGEGSDDCELYYPGAGGHWIPSFQQTVPSRPAWFTRSSIPDLYLTWVKAPIGDFWTLELQIPKTAGRAVVQFDARSGRQSVQTAKLPSDGRRYPVSPKSSAYQLDVAADADPDARSLLAVPVDGLNAEGWNLFRASDAGGRRLARFVPLYWGERYCLLVHARRKSLDAWPGHLERTRIGRGNDDWLCFEIELPTTPDPQIASWVQLELGRSLRAPDARLTVLAPTPVGVDQDGTLILDADDHMLLAVHGPPGCSHPGDLLVSAEQGTTTNYPLKTELPVFLSLGEWHSERLELALRDAPGATLYLRRERGHKFGEPPAVMLSATEVLSGAKRSGPVFSPEATAILECVRSGNCTDLEVSAPRGAAGRIGWRKPNLTWVEQVLESRIGSGRQVWNSNSQSLAEFLSNLGDAESELMIDFGSFGRALVTARPDQREALDSCCDPNKLAWIRTAAGGAFQATSAPGPGPGERSTVDKLHVMELRGYAPAWLVPHMRALRASISKRSDSRAKQ